MAAKGRSAFKCKEDFSMENKKYLPIKIIHLILMVAAIVLCCVSLTKITATSMYFSDSDIGLRIASYIAEIIE